MGTRQKISILIQNNCLFEQTASPSTIENLHEMSALTPTHLGSLSLIRISNIPYNLIIDYLNLSLDNEYVGNARIRTQVIKD